jgi:hypothetical protein
MLAVVDIKGTISSISCSKDGAASAAMVTTFAHGSVLIRACGDDGVDITSVVKDYLTNETLATTSVMSGDQQQAVIGDVHGDLFLLSCERGNSSDGLVAITPHDFARFGSVRSLSIFADQPHGLLCTYASRAAVVDLRCSRQHSLLIGFCVPPFLSAVGGHPSGHTGHEFAVATKEGPVLFFDMRCNREESFSAVTCSNNDQIVAVSSNRQDTIVLGAVSGRCYFLRSTESSVVQHAVAVTGTQRKAVLSLDSFANQTVIGISDGRNGVFRADCPECKLHESVSRGHDTLFPPPSPSIAPMADAENPTAAKHAASGTSCSAVAISNSHVWVAETADGALKSCVVIRPTTF